MLTDAISSETYKLLQNRWTAFWSFGFAPFITAVVSLGILAFVVMQVPAEIRAQPQDVSTQLVLSAYGTRSPSYYVAMLFCLLGAAVIFAGDYRWETWRLIAPRNSRTNHMLAKIVLFCVAIFAVMLMLVAVTLLTTVIGALINGAPMQWTLGQESNFWLVTLGLFGISCLQLIQAGAVVALASVLTRSLIGALLGTVFLSIVQLAIQGVVQQQPEIPLYQILMLPGLSADMLRLHVSGPMAFGQEIVTPAKALEALASLLLWIVVGYGAALALFQRQDLSKE
ncbi:MAG TPA: hypothetical protein VEC60_08210 [Reyranella sp.]|nr:hypothetical protein [Reyranella sp.]